MNAAAPWVQPIRGEPVHGPCRGWEHDSASAINALLLATQGVIFSGGAISIAQCNEISAALRGFDLDAHQGPYGVLIHAADIAVSRPDLKQALLALNAARNLIKIFLEESR